MTPQLRRPGGAIVVALVLVVPYLVSGCAQNPLRGVTSGSLRGAAAPPFSLEPPPGVAAPAHTLSVPAPLPSYADVDGRQLAVSLERSRQETQLMQDEIAALRDQLASTSTQLVEARSVGGPAAGAVGIGADMDDPSAGITPPATMRSAMNDLALPGVDARFDGSVVRIDIPADRLFEPGAAGLLPGGVATLTQIADELDRVFPGHFIGIEGHADTEPLLNTAWGSPHQLTAARSTAVFEFLTGRTRMKAGQLFLVAHGPNHPLVSNATAAGRARNRRVELVVYAERATAAD